MHARQVVFCSVELSFKKQIEPNYVLAQVVFSATHFEYTLLSESNFHISRV